MPISTRAFTVSGCLAVLMVLGLQTSSAAPKPAAVFSGKDVLMRPDGYRQWVFVGSSLGISYARDPEAGSTRPMLFHNVYIDPQAYGEFLKTKRFPEGTAMAMELTTSETKKEPGLQGTQQNEFAGLEVSVKDRTRFDGGWGYFLFTGPAGTLRDRAKAQAPETCWACHHEHAVTDHVFTQFYPVLRAVATSAPSTRDRQAERP